MAGPRLGGGPAWHHPVPTSELPRSHLWFPDAPLLRDSPSKLLSLPLGLALKGTCLSWFIITWLSSPAPLQGHLFLDQWSSDFIYYIKVPTGPDKYRSLGHPIPGAFPSGGLGLSPRMYMFTRSQVMLMLRSGEHTVRTSALDPLRGKACSQQLDRSLHQQPSWLHIRVSGGVGGLVKAPHSSPHPGLIAFRSHSGTQTIHTV